ncbi:MAG: NUDIX domain-containing protein [Bacteroidota bacterium]
MYRFYCQEKEIILDSIAFSEKDSIVILNSFELRNYYHLFFETINSSLIIYCKDINACWNQLCSDFYVIEAAGGCVIKNSSQLLCIYRFDKWDLPKGKIEEGELHSEAALREVMEETGLNGISIIKELPSTFHIYRLNSKNILKKTYWFEMICSSSENAVPQTEEGITEVKWEDFSSLNVQLSNTYASLRCLFEDYIKR